MIRKFRIVEFKKNVNCTIYDIEKNLFNLLAENNDFMENRNFGEFDTFEEAENFFDNEMYRTSVMGFMGNGEDDYPHEYKVHAYFVIEIRFCGSDNDWCYVRMLKQSKIRYFLAIRYLEGTTDEFECDECLHIFGSCDRYAELRERLRYFFICEQKDYVEDCIFLGMNVEVGDYSTFIPMDIKNDDRVYSEIRL